MAEHKTDVNQFGLVSNNSAATIQCLTLIQGGGNENTRVGTKITGTSLELQYYSRPYVAGAPPTQRWLKSKLVVFIWKDDTVPTYLDILDPIAATIPTYNLPNCPFSSNKKIKRKVLYTDDWASFHEYDGTTVSEFTGSVMHNKKVVIPLTKLRNNLNTINFDPSATDGTIAINHIYVMYITSDYELTNAGNVLSLVSKYSFIDM